MINSFSNNNRIVKNTLLLYFRMLFTMGVGLLTSRIIINALGATDYGIYNAVGGFVTMFSILSAGLSSATQRFLNIDIAKGDCLETRRTFSTFIFVYSIISIIVLILAETLGVWFLETKLTIPIERMFAARWVYQLSLVTLLISFVSTPYNALIISHERMKTFAYIAMYEVVAKLLIAYKILYTTYDKLIIYAIMLCLVQLSIRVIYNVYCNRVFQESKIIYSFNVDKIKSVYRYTCWAMFGSLASIGFTQGLNVLLNMFFLPAVNAARAIAVQVQYLVNSFVVNFQTAINPQIMKSYAQGNFQYLYKLMFSSAKYSYLLIFCISLPLLIESDLLLKLWLKEVPEHSVVFLRLIMVTTMIDAISNPFMRAVDATGQIKKYQLIVGSTLLMIVPISYIVLKCGGSPSSVFIVHIIIGIVAFVFRMLLAKNLIGFSLKLFFYEVLLKLFFVTCLSTILPIFLYILIPQSISRFIAILFVSILCTIFFVYTIALTSKEREFCLNKLKFRIK